LVLLRDAAGKKQNARVRKKKRNEAHALQQMLWVQESRTGSGIIKGESGFVKWVEG
jgi:hypothetical protein